MVTCLPVLLAGLGLGFWGLVAWQPLALVLAALWLLSPLVVSALERDTPTPRLRCV